MSFDNVPLDSKMSVVITSLSQSSKRTRIAALTFDARSRWASVMVVLPLSFPPTEKVILRLRLRDLRLLELFSSFFDRSVLSALSLFLLLSSFISALRDDDDEDTGEEVCCLWFVSPAASSASSLGKNMSPRLSLELKDGSSYDTGCLTLRRLAEEEEDEHAAGGAPVWLAAVTSLFLGRPLPLYGVVAMPAALAPEMLFLGRPGPLLCGVTPLPQLSLFCVVVGLVAKVTSLFLGRPLPLY